MEPAETARVDPSLFFTDAMSWVAAEPITRLPGSTAVIVFASPVKEINVGSRLPSVRFTAQVAVPTSVPPASAAEKNCT